MTLSFHPSSTGSQKVPIAAQYWPRLASRPAAARVLDEAAPHPRALLGAA